MDAWRRDPDAPGWTQSMVVTVAGAAGESDLENAVARFIETHDIFRLRVDPAGGAWAAPAADRFADIEFLDFTDLPPGEQETELSWMILDEVGHGWDLSDAWPVRVNVVGLDPDRWAVVFLFHRLVYHSGVRDRYTAAFAKAFGKTGEPGANTAPAPADTENLSRPSWTDYVRASGPARVPSEAGTVTQDLAPLYPALGSLAADLSLEIPDLLLAGVLVWHHLFARIAAPDLETEVPDESADPGTRSLGPDVRRTRIPAAVADDVSPADLARQVNRLRSAPARPAAVSKEFADSGIRFSWAGPDTAVYTSGQVRIIRSDVGFLATEYDLELIFSFTDTGSALTLVYDQRLMGFDAAASLAREIRAVLGAVMDGPGEPVATLQQKLAESRRPVPVPAQSPAPESSQAPEQALATPEALFARTAAKYPDHTAVATAGGCISYRDLDAQSGRLARAVFAAAGSGGRIGILMTQNIGAVIAILAVLRSGNAYVPLDVTAPPRRLEITASDADLSLVILDQEGQAVWQQADRPDLPVLHMPDINGLPGLPDHDPQDPEGKQDPEVLKDPPSADPGDDAYIIYTSGTTGRPKGVVQTRENVCHFARTYAGYLDITPNDSLTLMSAFQFDAAVLDIFTALSTGAKLVMFDLKKEDLSAVTRRLHTDRVTVYHSTASVFRYWIDAMDPSERFPMIRYAVLGGEPGFRNDLVRFQAHFDVSAVLINLYGLSELTIGTMGFFNRDADVDTKWLPIGGPIAGVSVTVVDEQDRLTPRAGQMVFAGPCLARGYWGRPDLTAEKFADNPHTTRSFATGDIGEITDAGTLIHLGRKDFQIKIRGYRVEPGEIEACITAHDQVDKCVVHPVTGKDGESVPAAFIVPVSNAAGVTVEVLARFLALSLPDYMIPQKVIPVPAFPRTASGKIDRKALEILAGDAG